MFVTKRQCFDIVTLFCQYQVCLKCQKRIYESFSANETFSAKSKKGSTKERLYLSAKDEKGYPVLSIGFCGDKDKKSLKDDLALFFSFYFRIAGTVH